MAMFTLGGFTIQSPQMLGIAFLGGALPSILWLLFWLREIRGNRQPILLLVTTFIAGMLSVMVVLPIQKLIGAVPESAVFLLVMWAASEEIIKCMAFGLIMANSPALDRPVEYPIYFMTAALGFAALENTLFLLHPLSTQNTTLALLTGNMRFLGSTLLHAVASGIVGIAIGLAFFKSPGTRAMYGTIGLIVAIALHSVFNFFIGQNDGKDFLQVFGFLWVTTILIMLLFERLRRMGKYISTPSTGIAPL
jgi:RsiW-degrading membrane proteinase PrsW (M82 family)